MVFPIKYNKDISLYLIKLLFCTASQILSMTGIWPGSAEAGMECPVEGKADTSSFGESIVLNHMDFFESMCVCVPYFDSLDELDNAFYAQLINSSICGPLGSSAESVTISEPPYDMAKISQTDMADYALLLFNIKLSAYEISLKEMQKEEGNFYYENGYYYIGWYDPLDIIYTYTGCQSAENGNLIVKFSMSEAIEDAFVLFELAPADNQNGFIIVSKKWTD